MLDFICGQVIFTNHGFVRMQERGLLRDEVLRSLQTGRVINEYPDALPYPCYLVLSFVGLVPLHTVVAHDATHGDCLIITAYRPTLVDWLADFATRRTRSQ